MWRVSVSQSDWVEFYGDGEIYVGEGIKCGAAPPLMKPVKCQNSPLSDAVWALEIKSQEVLNWKTCAGLSMHSCFGVVIAPFGHSIRQCYFAICQLILVACQHKAIPAKEF
jgi:hypothetical protein